MKSKRTTAARFGPIAAVSTLAGTTILFVVGQFGRLSPVLDVLSHLSSHYVAMGLSALIALWIGRHHIVVLSLGATLTITGHSALGFKGQSDERGVGITPAYARTTTAPRSERALKVISLNSWHSNRTPDEIVNYLKREKADVVILVEFGPSKLKLLGRLARDYPYQVHCAAKWYCSLALLSRIPFSKAKATSPTSKGPALVWARLKSPGKPGDGVTIVGTHLYRPSSRPRLHVSHLSELAKFVNQLQAPYVVAGDFNTTPWSQSYRDFLGATGLKPSGRMLPSWPAWPLPLPQFAIDHLFASPKLIVTDRGIGPFVGSDHLPIWALIRARQ